MTLKLLEGHNRSLFNPWLTFLWTTFVQNTNSLPLYPSTSIAMTYQIQNKSYEYTKGIYTLHILVIYYKFSHYYFLNLYYQF